MKRLAVNGRVRQETTLDRLIWPVPELLSELSSLFELKPGDLVFTGTPAGVGPLVPGDRVEAALGAHAQLSFEIVARDE